MNKKLLFGYIFLIVCFLSTFGILLAVGKLTVLNPAGWVGMQERNLFFLAIGIMMCLALPVLGALFFIAWHYRAENHKAHYNPETKNPLILKFLWWIIPASLVIIFGFIIWHAAHTLDPYKQIISNNKPIIIQVVALRWKWLFIYPREKIATVNYLAIPVNTPINFQLTAGDAPMNSFWIPKLGGQIYAMSAMETKMSLIANQVGDFPGQAAEINGEGYADMRFDTHVTSQTDYKDWVAKMKESSKPLDKVTFEQISKPALDTSFHYYTLPDANFYNELMMSYMQPSSVHMQHEN